MTVYLALMHKAFILASEAHEGQVDKINEPYINHPVRVSNAVWNETKNELAATVALLHDVVEDTEVTLVDLVGLGFPIAVVHAVNCISKRKGESFKKYYDRVKSNPLATIVKWYDVADNADPRRLAKVAPDTRARLKPKYEAALIELSK